MRYLRYLLVLSLITPLLFSCNSEQPGDELTKRWLSEADSTHYLVFTRSDDARNFERLSENGVEKGTWSIEEGTLTLSYVANTSWPVDSIIYNTDGGEANIEMVGGEDTIVLQQDGTISNTPVTEAGTYEVEGRMLTLKLDSGEQNYYYPELAKSGFSFTALGRGLLGLVVLLGIAWLCSANRKAISWSLVGKGLLIQLVLAATGHWKCDKWGCHVCDLCRRHESGFGV